TEERELLRAREPLDRRLARLGLGAGRGLLDVPDGERPAAARVARSLARGVRGEALLHVVRDPDVERAVAALEDVDEPGHAAILASRVDACSERSAWWAASTGSRKSSAAERRARSTRPARPRASSWP